MTATVPTWLPCPVDIHTGRDAWLAARQERIASGGVGSTTAAALLGLSPWRTPWDVWAAVHAPHLLEERKPADPRLLARGLALEGLADRLYREETGAQTCGVDLHMTVTSGVLSVSPDAFCRTPEGVGVCEYKVIQPWKRGGYPSADLEIRTLADLDAASSMGRWPVDRQYVVQCVAHLLASGLDYCDLYCLFAQDVKVGHMVAGWDTPVAVEDTARMRIWRDGDLCDAVTTSLADAHQRIIVEGAEPLEHRPPPPWDSKRDPLKGKRDAEPEEVSMLADLAELTHRHKADKAQIDTLRARLRDTIADSGSACIRAKSTAGKITASVSARGRLTIRGL